MFSNGKFKNVVALVNSKDECPLPPWTSLNHTYSLQPTKGTTKNWIALEDSFNKPANVLASTVTCNSNSPQDRNVFAIYVSYYVKVKIFVSAMGGELSLKLPFTLTHGMDDIVDPLVLEAKLNAEDSSNHQRVVKSNDDDEKIIKNAEVECHEPNQLKSKNKVTNLLSAKCKTNKSNNTMEDENEIIKLEEEKPI